MVVLISKYIPGLYCLFLGEISYLCLNFPSLFLCSLVSLFLFASKEHHTLFSSSDWLIKFSVWSSRLHSCGNLEHSFIFSVLLFHNWVIVHLCLRMTLSLSFNLSGHFVVLCLGYYVSNVAVNAGVHESFWVMVFSAHWPRWRCQILGLACRKGFWGFFGMQKLSFLRDVGNVHSHQPCSEVQTSPGFLPHLLFIYLWWCPFGQLGFDFLLFWLSFPL